MAPTNTSPKKEKRYIDILTPVKPEPLPGTIPDDSPTADDDITENFALSTSEYDASQQKKTSLPETLDRLQKAIAPSNKELEENYWNYLANNTKADGSAVTLIDAMNFHFDYLRHTIADTCEQANKYAQYTEYIKPKYNKLKTDFTALQEERDDLERLLTNTQLRNAEYKKETQRLTDHANNLENKYRLLTKEKTPLEVIIAEEEYFKKQQRKKKMEEESYAPTMSIPKALLTPLQANPIEAYNGTPDVDTIFKFIKQLEYHTNLLEDEFTNAELVKYATSYLTDSAADWARAWKKNASITSVDRTFESFITTFKARWIPANAHIHLTNKLNRMEFRGASQIDQFNHEYRNTLKLLQLDPTHLLESNQYYQIYMSKIKDSNVLMSVHQYAFGKQLSLDIAMDYVAQMFAIKIASQPATTSTSSSNRSDRYNQRGKKTTEKVNSVTTDANSDINTVSTRTNRPYGVPRCFACDATDHIIKNCPMKADWDKHRNQSKDANQGKD
ncbi:hypothetical protein BJ508DRAFT_327238 [Ascobolus immersus RN42]|uniref:Ty3 transposon capsid-like protein domain-containing protein n=1 Tax=Ascobolus immersus RN42 TaxID=1160509 RepID=A0A3N4I8R5_ASCIM|nr:hypothetical protein BJ508DRAFT_327238 [Ascobolus immersus RN42]